jgi:hypothetical protein
MTLTHLMTLTTLTFGVAAPARRQHGYLNWHENPVSGYKRM